MRFRRAGCALGNNRKINKAVKKNEAEIAIIEIGGTVGEYQNILFLEAVRILKIENFNDTLLVLVSYLPHIGQDSEPKTKPTQHAARTLNSAGLQPDIIVARSTEAIDEKRKEKIAFNCGMSSRRTLFPLPRVENIYEIPLNFEKNNISEIICRKLKIKPRQKRFQRVEKTDRQNRESQRRSENRHRREVFFHWRFHFVRFLSFRD